MQGSGIEPVDQGKGAAQEKGGAQQSQKQNHRLNKDHFIKVIHEDIYELGEKELAVTQEMADQKGQEGCTCLGERKEGKDPFDPVPDMAEEDAAQGDPHNKGRHHEGKGIGGGPDNESQEADPDNLVGHGSKA